MAQHDMNIANQGFPATRADINNALQAIATNNSGTSAPSTTFANQWFYNETSNKLFIRNEANNAFIEVATLDQTNNEWQITTGQISASDSDGLVFKTDDGNTRITLSDGGDVTFAAGTDIITASAGNSNVRIGTNAGSAIASGGDNNTAIGEEALEANTTGINNTAVGKQALTTQTTAARNTAVGNVAGAAVTTGSNNTFMGDNAGNDLTTGNRNVIIGQAAGDSATTTDDSVLIGFGAGGGAIMTGHDNTAMGTNALNATTSGTQNVAIGRNALLSNTTASNSTAVGFEALENSTTASSNTAVGYKSGYDITTGINNTLVGYESGENLTTGTLNVAVGLQALRTETTGSRTTALGYQALKVQNTENANANTAVGYGAGVDVTTANQSTLIGSDAGGDLTTGNKNTLIGEGAGVRITTGASNTIIGRYSGNAGGLDIRTSDNNIVLSDGDGNPRLQISEFGELAAKGVQTTSTTFDGNYGGGDSRRCLLWHQAGGSTGRPRMLLESHTSGAVVEVNQCFNNTSFRGLLKFYRRGTEIGSISGGTSSTVYNTTSDHRLKENIVDLNNATDRLKQLEPKRFNFIAEADTTVDGFLAHEVQSVVPEAITGTYNQVETYEEEDDLPDGVSLGDNKLDENGNTIPKYQGIDQSKLVPLLTAALQEAIAKIEALETRVAALEG